MDVACKVGDARLVAIFPLQDSETDIEQTSMARCSMHWATLRRPMDPALFMPMTPATPNLARSRSIPLPAKPRRSIMNSKRYSERTCVSYSLSIQKDLPIAQHMTRELTSYCAVFPLILWAEMYCIAKAKNPAGDLLSTLCRAYTYAYEHGTSTSTIDFLTPVVLVHA